MPRRKPQPLDGWALSARQIAKPARQKDYLRLTSHCRTVVGSDCWRWIGAGAKDKKPAASIVIAEKGTHRQISARAAMWLACTGEVAQTPVMSTCGNVLCVRPEHMQKQVPR